MDENRLPELPQEAFRPMIAQSVQLEQFLGKELIFCFRDLDGVHTFTTCYGDIYKTVNALRDYVRLLESVCDQWELTGFHRATYEYHAEKLRKIADKLQAGIGYDYDKAVERCKKKRARKSHSSDVGEDALLLPVWLPEQIIQTNTSIGQVLSSVEIDTSLVASHVTVLKNYPFIGMMGYAAGENPLSYPEVKYTMVLQLIHAAAKLVDFVILDCSTSMTNVFTPAAIEAGDVVIRILTPDLKGINYLKAHQPLLVDERFRFSEHMTFAGLARPFHALDEMGYIIGGFDGLLPYSKEIDRCATEGGMFKAITYCNPKYTASLNKVLEILEQMELAEQSEEDVAYECEEDADE